jgi:RNA polymerase sigma factor (sigma-70 family)
VAGRELSADEVQRFESFFRDEYARLVWHVAACGYDEYAEDAADEAMRSLLDVWQSVRSPKAWTRTVAERYALREWKRDRARRRHEDRLAQLAVHSAEGPPEARVEWSQEQRALDWMGKLPQRRRQVVALVFDGYGVGEIAEQLGIEENTVRSHLRHVRNAYPDFFSAEGGERG